MPAPSRTSLERIILLGRSIVDADGIEALTMQRVAADAGVRAPSLYKHVQDRRALVQLIALDAVNELGGVMGEAACGADPAGDLRAIAIAFRAWARDHPGGYALLFAPLPESWRLAPETAGGAFDALFGAINALAPPDRRLEAARTVVAWASGFIGMELAGAFQMGGDIDRAYGFGIDRITRAIAADTVG